jgi:hypothetical protein
VLLPLFFSIFFKKYVALQEFFHKFANPKRGKHFKKFFQLLKFTNADVAQLARAADL